MISCDLHDTIEIVCLYSYPIRLLLKSGAHVTGTALDTAYDADRNECIKIDNGSCEQLVLLDSISSMQVTVDNPHLDLVSF